MKVPGKTGGRTAKKPLTLAVSPAFPYNLWMVAGEADQPLSTFEVRMDEKTNEEPPFTTTLAHAAADPFRLLVEAVKDYGIFMLDPAGNVTSWNPGAEKSKGYQAEEIIGQHISCFY